MLDTAGLREALEARRVHVPARGLPLNADPPPSLGTSPSGRWCQRTATSPTAWWAKVFDDHKDAYAGECALDAVTAGHGCTRIRADETVRTGVHRGCSTPPSTEDTGKDACSCSSNRCSTGCSSA
ncbi:MAG: hypothetical protein U5L11_12800 [Arhodomonas sp.]|nr:hypothetical protein [Arhodomonas sp.]